VANQQYLLTIGAMNKRNPGSTATCNTVAPPRYAFVVPLHAAQEDNPAQASALTADG
jgi:hypothetical protein